jgi:hypothetical protein
MTKFEDNVMAAFVILTIGLGIFSILGDFTVVAPDYNRQVGDHMAIAKTVSTFEQAKAELILARQGMLNLGLNPSDYDTPWSWAQTPQNRMSYQYELTNASIARADYYIALSTNGNHTQLDDAYSSRLSSFRDTIHDQIAYGTYVLKYHPLSYGDYFILEVIGYVVTWFFIMGAVLIYEDGLIYRKGKDKFEQIKMAHIRDCPKNRYPCYESHLHGNYDSLFDYQREEYEK